MNYKMIMANRDDYKESPTMREIHQIRQELEKQQEASGLSYAEWLRATEGDLKKTLAEVGFEMATRDGRVFVHEIEPASKALKKLSAPPAPSTRSKKNKHKSYEDYMEDSTMQELHQIRAELERQQEASGLSFLDWLQATEKDLRKSLAGDGFRMVKRGDRIFMYEIKPHSKSNGKIKTPAKARKKFFAPTSPSQREHVVKHKNYDDYYSEAAATRELQLVREDRASSDKTEPPPQKKPVKYKTTAKRRTKSLRRK